MEQNHFILADLKISPKQKIDFFANNISSLTKEQLEKIPDALEGNKLSSYQKGAFAMEERIDFLNPKASDELKARYTLTNENKISSFYPSGEENVLKGSDVKFEKQNNESQKTKNMPWEGGQKQDQKTGISR